MTIGRSAAERRLRQIGGLIVFFTVLFYVPLAFTYFLAGPDQHRLQDGVMDLVLGPAFAFGLGSGYDGHMATYVENYATMWTHTVAGSLGLAAGASQFSDRLRARHLNLHRFLGRVYLVCAVIVAGSAMSYLVHTGFGRIFSGPAFADVLWLLAIGTTVSSVLALVAILRRDITAHRELMAMSFALILSAPLLRQGWLAIGLIWDTNKEMINLTEGAWAGPLLFTGAILYVRRYAGGRRRAASPLASTRAFRIAGAASVIGVVVLIGVATQTTWSGTPVWFVPGWGPWLALALAPFLVQFAFFAVMARAASRRGDVPAVTAWRTYLVGMAAAPAFAAAMLVFATLIQGMPLAHAWWAAPLGWNFALFAAYIGHTLATTTAFTRRPATAALDGALTAQPA